MRESEVREMAPETSPRGHYFPGRLPGYGLYVDAERTMHNFYALAYVPSGTRVHTHALPVTGDRGTDPLTACECGS